MHNCPSLGTSFQDTLSFHTTVTNDLIPKYLELGINNFKLEGRNASISNNIENYIYYLIKPEYQNEIKNLLIQNNHTNLKDMLIFIYVTTVVAEGQNLPCKDIIFLAFFFKGLI